MTGVLPPVSMKIILRTAVNDNSRARLLLLLLLLEVFLAPAAMPSQSVKTNTPTKNRPANDLVLRDATLFDSRRGIMVPDQSLIIRGERIAWVGEHSSLPKLPRRAQVLDLHGKFIIPGLIDAHVHLIHKLNDAHITADEMLPMFLAAGVTSVRDIGDPVVPQKMLARFSEAHPESCPRVFMCSPLIDGAQPYHRDIGWALTDPEVVPAFVEDMSKWGVTTLKMYVGTERKVGQRVIEEAHKRGLMVTGHLGLYSAQDAVADGIDCLEHIWSVFDYIIPAEVRQIPHYRSSMDLNTPIARDLITNLVQRHVLVDPTLTVFKNLILLNDLPSVNQNPENALAPARLREQWNSYRLYFAKNTELTPREFRIREFQKYQELTLLLYRAGVPLLAGTDTPEWFVLPGFSLLQELELFVEAGLPPSAALQSATINNAHALKQESQLGSIEPGKLADLVILSADPTANIRNVRRIEKVIRSGKICEPAQLLKLVSLQ